MSHHSGHKVQFICPKIFRLQCHNQQNLTHCYIVATSPLSWNSHRIYMHCHRKCIFLWHLFKTCDSDHNPVKNSTEKLENWKRKQWNARTWNIIRLHSRCIAMLDVSVHIALSRCWVLCTLVGGCVFAFVQVKGRWCWFRWRIIAWYLLTFCVLIWAWFILSHCTGSEFTGSSSDDDDDADGAVGWDGQRIPKKVPGSTLKYPHVVLRLLDWERCTYH